MDLTSGLAGLETRRALARLRSHGYPAPTRHPLPPPPNPHAISFHPPLSLTAPSRPPRTLSVLVAPISPVSRDLFLSAGTLNPATPKRIALEMGELPINQPPGGTCAVKLGGDMNRLLVAFTPGAGPMIGYAK